MNKSLVAAMVVTAALLGSANFFFAQTTGNDESETTKDGMETKSKSFQPKAVAPEDRLSVEETLGLVFTTFIDSPTEHLSRHANPEARKALRRILENDALAQYHASAWGLLGYVGDEADLKRLEKSLRNDFRGVLEGYDRRIVPAMFTAVALMVRRKVKGAEELADKMMTPNYWEKAKFRWYAESPPKQPDFVYYTMYRFLLSYARSLDPKMREKIARIRKHFQQLDDERIEPYFNREKSFDPKSLGDLLLSTAYTSLARENRPVTNRERKAIRRNFNGDLGNPRPGPPTRGDNTTNDEPAERAQTNSGKDAIPRSRVERLIRVAERFQLNAEGQLSYVALHRDDIHNEALTLLSAAPHLKHVTIVSTDNVTDEGLKHLKPLKHLDHLTFSRTPNITDQGLKFVGELRTLTRLKLLYMPQIGDEGLKHLKPLENLKHLSLDNLSVTDEGLKHLKALTNLDFLELYQGGITGGVTDEGLEHLAALKNLKELRISSRSIKGSGLKHLQELKNLERLSLSGMPLGDEDLEHLQKCRSLKKLSIGASTTIDGPSLYSNNALSRLKKALPETEITAGRRYRRPRR